MEKKICFSVAVTVKDMYSFLLRHFYTGMSGIVDVLLTVGLIVLAVYTYGSVPASYTVLYAVIAVLFIVYPFVNMRQRAKVQVNSPQLQGSLDYEADENGIAVIRGEERADYAWEDLKKVIETKSLILVYLNSARAFIWPKSQIGEQYDALKVMMNEKLFAYQNKLKK